MRNQSTRSHRCLSGIKKLFLGFNIINLKIVTTPLTMPWCHLQNSGTTKKSSSLEKIKDNYILSILIIGLTTLVYHSHLFIYTVYDCLKASSTFSSCDSRNLNLSPFCNTSSTSLAMWQPSVLETYGEKKNLSYLDEMTVPMRQRYPNSMPNRELITSLTEVTIWRLSVNYESHWTGVSQ